MATSYRTPAVYIEEIPTLPPSVAAVSTAIPAFLGYTELYAGKGTPQVAQVSTLLEYTSLFGGPQRVPIEVAGTGNNLVSKIPALSFLMYYSVSHYFVNGGGPCYIVALGDYSSGSPKHDDFVAGLAALEKEDEPTLILLTDAVTLSATDYYDLCQRALTQCNKLGDRFCIFDVKDKPAAPDRGVQDFRDQTGVNYLKYGAAYHPYLNTTLSIQYTDDQVTVDAGDVSNHNWQKTLDPKGVTVSFLGAGGPTVTIVQDATATTPTFTISRSDLTIRAATASTGTATAGAWTTFKTQQNVTGWDVSVAGDGSAVVQFQSTTALDDKGAAPASLQSIQTSNTALYQQVKSALAGVTVTLPPSGAVAGIYASVDRDRGVWKAPANVSISSVIGPILKINNDQQENLNVDSTGGKSINAIRAFTGKGTLVWGSRTLAGNDNEWRYVPVRRLFSMIEESCRRSTAFAVFEPNDLTTWLKVKGMVESFLYGLWEQGALAGATPDAAYFVNVGLGKTMTTQDVLEGRMIVEIGIAAVRPAEFIILRFSHKLQQA
jgi:phage tail sheath protein FI